MPLEQPVMRTTFGVPDMRAHLFDSVSRIVSDLRADRQTERADSRSVLLACATEACGTQAEQQPEDEQPGRDPGEQGGVAARVREWVLCRTGSAGRATGGLGAGRVRPGWQRGVRRHV